MSGGWKREMEKARTHERTGVGVLWDKVGRKAGK